MWRVNKEEYYRIARATVRKSLVYFVFFSFDFFSFFFVNQNGIAVV